MDEKLKKALEYSKYMITLNNQKRVILEEYNESLNFYFNGGKFQLTYEFLSFCKLLLDFKQTTTILTDVDGIPIEINDLKTFLDSALSQRITASNEYLFKYQKLMKQRSVQGVLNL